MFHAPQLAKADAEQLHDICDNIDGNPSTTLTMPASLGPLFVAVIV